MNKAEANLLIHEQSPYLLQHAYNPVYWRAWNDETFALAIRENKPVFLSIGYSTCHWCHVMERESFESQAIAAILNEHFIAIKVDREERPDIDGVYMAVCQAMTGHGGWPLSVFMTPQKEPFFVGTYFPPEDRHGRPGFGNVLQQLAQLWRDERQRIRENAASVVGQMRSLAAAAETDAPPANVLEQAYAQYRRNFDEKHGGFGRAPKFPSPQNLLFLLRYYKRSGQPEALTMVERTLQGMRRGGMYDHIGYGFHRYSTDARWLLPHFEKMLYDQAMLAIAYTECWQCTGNALYRQTAEEILHYVLRDMSAPEGGFYSAEDADSEGREGKFYVWEAAELARILDGEELQFFAEAYGIRHEGNFAEEATGEFTGENIPHLERDIGELARGKEMDPVHYAERLAAIRAKLFAQRESRVHPGKDDKILTDWNALMITALAIAARAFDTPSYLAAAERAWNFLHARMFAEHGRLLHRYRAGHAAIPAFLDDYAYLCWAAFELYQSGGNPACLRSAIDLADTLLADFADRANGGFHFGGAHNEELFMQSKEGYDGALPSGNSVAACMLAKLGHLLNRAEYREAARATLAAFGAYLERHPSGFAMLLQAHDFLTVGPAEIVIAGNPECEHYRAMLREFGRRFMPHAVLVCNSGSPELQNLVEFAAYQTAQDGRATAYICRDYTCRAPLHDAAAFGTELDSL